MDLDTLPEMHYLHQDEQYHDQSPQSRERKYLEALKYDMVLDIPKKEIHLQKVINPFDTRRNIYIGAHQWHEQNYDMDFHHDNSLINQ